MYLCFLELNLQFVILHLVVYRSLSVISGSCLSSSSPNRCRVECAQLVPVMDPRIVTRLDG